MHLKTLESVLDSLAIKSLANGNMLVEIKYSIPPLEAGATPVGVLTRLAIADEIAELLHEHIGKIRYARDARAKRRKAK